MKKIYLMTIAVVAMLLTACKNDNDPQRILETIPNDAVVASVGDMRAVLENLGAEFDGDKINLPSNVKDELFVDFDDFEDGETGIDISTFGYFKTDEESSYIVGFVADKKKFIKFMEEATESNFEKEAGLLVAEGVATDGKMFWLASNKHKLARAVARFKDLKTEESLAVTPLAERILDESSTITTVINVKRCLRLADNIQPGASTMAKAAIASIFDDASFVVSQAVLEGNKVKGTAEILTSDYKKAECALPLSPIDSATILASDQKTANIVVAAGISKGLIDVVDKLLASFGGIPSQFKFVNAINGTVAFLMDGDETNGLCLIADMSTDEYDADIIKVFSDGETNIDRKGDRIIISTPAAGVGALNINDVAKKFNGKYIGIALTDLAAQKNYGRKHSSDVTVITLEKDGTSLKINLNSEVKGKYYLQTLFDEMD